MREHFGARRVKRRALRAEGALGFKILQKPNPTGQLFQYFIFHFQHKL